MTEAFDQMIPVMMILYSVLDNSLFLLYILNKCSHSACDAELVRVCI